jgi:sugar lactone lactonase YvrE
MTTTSKSLIMAAGAAVFLAGCGGSVSTVSSGGGDTGGTREAVGTAKLRVDLGSGHVTVTPLSGDPDGRALFTGNAIGVTSSRVLNDEGELTIRGIKATLTNNTDRAIGADGSFRVVFSDFANLGGLSTDYSAETVVSTPASVSRPYGVDTDFAGNVYFTSKASGKVYKYTGGSATELSSGHDGPTGITDMPGTDFLAVSESGGDVIVLVSKTSGGRTVLAGTGVNGSNDGTAASAQFNGPDGITVDSAGNIYVLDAGSGWIRIISDPFGSPVVDTMANSFFTTGADIDVMEIKGVEILIVATKHAVQGVALPGQQVFTIAGNQTVSGNVNGAGDVARFKLVRGVDAANGAIYVMDSQNYQVKQVTLDPGGNPMNSADWHVARLAGTGTNGFADGAGNVAQIEYSQHIAASASGKLYAASYSGDDLRLIESEFSTLPFLGSGGSGATEPVKLANADGFYKDDAQSRAFLDYAVPVNPSASVTLDEWTFLIPEDVAAFEFVMAVESSTASSAALPANLSPGSQPAGSSDVYVRLLAGSSNPGATDGLGGGASFNSINDIAAASDGTVYITDGANDSIRRMTADGRVSTIAGDTTRTGAPTNTTGDLVSFILPAGIAVSPDGSVVYVVDYGAHLICRLQLSSPNADPTDSANWNVRVIAGTGTLGYTNGDGAAAQFQFPWDVAIGAKDETLYVTDTSLNKVRLLRLIGSNATDAADWDVSLLAGSDATTSTSGYVDDLGSLARFNLPLGITVGPDSNIYVADQSNARIRVLTAQGQVTTLAGNGSLTFADSLDGATAKMNVMYGLAADKAGYVYVAENSLDALRRVSTSSGETKTVVGSAGGPIFTDGLGSVVRLDHIRGVAVLPNGEVIAASTHAIHRVHRIIDDSSR